MKCRQPQRHQTRSTTILTAFAALSVTALCAAYTTSNSLRPFGTSRTSRSTATTRLYIIAPQGSGYATPDDETSPFPDTYEPMMEYPGTMRPGRTPEDQPFHDLPIGDDDPDPVPWPHFQQIEWHHRWDPPHAHAIPMEEFIELEGRWATPEMEAAMRAGARQDVRERREQAEAEQKATVVMDDDEDDFEADIPVELGDGMFGQLGSGAENAATAAAVAPPGEQEEATTEEEEEETDDFDDFFLDLGLDSDGGADDTSDKKKGGASKKGAMDMLLEETDDDDGSDDVDLGLELGLLDDDDEEGATDLGSIALVDDDDDITAITDMDDDDDGVDFDEDEEDLLSDDGVTTVPLDDFGDSAATDGENPFDDGGYDLDDGDLDMDGGDMW